MKTRLFFLGYLFLTFEKVLSTSQKSQAQKKVNYYDVALEKVVGLALTHLKQLNEDNVLEMGLNVYGCVSRTKDLICNENSTEFTECIDSVKNLFEMTLDTKYEHYTKMLLKSLISAENFFCHGKIKEVFDVLLSSKNVH
ncbi:uncharacterized protein LOC123679620 [Harmonia axyridis]|uniref:uncharacterized protein LOC123679620 n=1 Tax=Harmonia axyridis TaxID=115357 RepID=UPI001E276734|nr:uncharacterized protein LOC123679620 [Harmonia axyridis]